MKCHVAGAGRRNTDLCGKADTSAVGGGGLVDT